MKNYNSRKVVVNLRNNQNPRGTFFDRSRFKNWPRSIQNEKQVSFVNEAGLQSPRVD